MLGQKERNHFAAMVGVPCVIPLIALLASRMVGPAISSIGVVNTRISAVRLLMAQPHLIARLELTIGKQAGTMKKKPSVVVLDKPNACPTIAIQVWAMLGQGGRSRRLHGVVAMRRGGVQQRRHLPTIAMLECRIGRRDGLQVRRSIAAKRVGWVAMHTIAMRVLRTCGPLRRSPIVVIMVGLGARQPPPCHSIACLVLPAGRRVGTRLRRTSVVIMAVQHATHTIVLPGYPMGGPLASWSGAATTGRSDVLPPMGRYSLIAKLGLRIGRRVGTSRRKIIAARWEAPSARNMIARRASLIGKTLGPLTRWIGVVPTKAWLALP
mmetsp:Transcript_81713/g.205611  ORF Transcript_81713/g.205611 Transcript_81713/m.205611 type:complete len:323 (-) Transcript_81713:474-1442(-)